MKIKYLFIIKYLKSDLKFLSIFADNLAIINFLYSSFFFFFSFEFCINLMLYNSDLCVKKEKKKIKIK